MARQFKFDRGDWVAVRKPSDGQYRLAGKVVDADSESITVQSRTGLRSHFVVGVDPIARVTWRGSRWVVA